jgi:hypothetical protein
MNNLPLHATLEIKEDPHEVLAQIFDCMDKNSLQKHLWELLKTSITGSFHTIPPDEQKVLVIAYEQLSVLLETAHEIHIRHTPIIKD